MVGLIRGVSEGLGPVGGAAAIYSLSGLLLIFTVGFPRIRQIPKGYLLAGSLLCCMECRYIAWQCHHYGGRFVFYACTFLSACSRAAQRPAVVLVLARRADGLRRFPALLAGDTSWLK